MSAPPLVQAAAKVLERETLEDRPVSDDERARTIGAIRGALAARATRRARRRWLAPVAAAAAILVLCGGAFTARRWIPSKLASAPVTTAPASQEARLRAPNISVERLQGQVYFEGAGGAGGAEPLSPNAVVPSGRPITTAEGELVLALRSGSKLDIARATGVTVSDYGEIELVRLDRGSVTSRVAKLEGAQQYIVRTPDADVEVRGTVFTVSRLADGACGERTRVHVDEGRVVVRSAPGSVTLSPGDEWTSPCVSPATPATAAAASTRAGTVARASTAPRRGAPAAPEAVVEAPPERLDLTAQNALFAEAMSAKSHGDSRKAVATLDALLEKHPRTPLREAAEAQRMNLLVEVDRARAVALAKEYLARYPRGFARADAEAILRVAP